MSSSTPQQAAGAEGDAPVPASCSSTSSGFLDPNMAAAAAADKNSGARSPRKLASRILSRTSSRQSIQNGGAVAAADATSEEPAPADVVKRLQALALAAAPTGTGPCTTPGHIGNLSLEQESKLSELVKRLSAHGTLCPFPSADDAIDAAALCTRKPSHSALGAAGRATDTGEDAASQQRINLLRFLRARSWNVDAAVEMYEKAHEWKFRKPSPADAEQDAAQQPGQAPTAAAAASAAEVPLDIEHKLQSNWTFPQEEQVASLGWKMYFHKTDKLGRPIFIQDLSYIDTASIFKLVTPQQIVEKYAVTLEQAIRYRYAECSRVAGRTIEDNYMILNAEGLGLSTFWSMKSQLQTLLGILDNNFPELSGHVQIINAPWVFATIFSYIRGWLPPATRDKIDISGADYRDTLLQLIDADALPTSLGGTCTCEGVPIPGASASGEPGAAAAHQPGARGGRCGRTDVGPWPKSYKEWLELRAQRQAEAKGTAATAPGAEAAAPAPQ